MAFELLFINFNLLFKENKKASLSLTQNPSLFQEIPENPPNLNPLFILANIIVGPLLSQYLWKIQDYPHLLKIYIKVLLLY